ncbi:MAG: hypothetical protein IBJ16_08795 [Chitinophagaceae bacterium]|nr:hypothetical protein [Chitinophagaceae bacterium]
MNQNFKLIAIRPLDGCAKNYLKVLQPNYCYIFNNEYEIKVNQRSEMADEIVYRPEVPENFFDEGSIRINLCALVGKNGSGKSSLVELLYIGIYNMARALGMIHKDANGRSYYHINDIKFEIYIQVSDNFYKIRFNDRKFFHYEFNSDGKGIRQKEEIIKKPYLNSFFYNLVINYSLYGLNTRESGRWLKPIFHKNDAYQTPIVLNPFRDEGKIDINTENYLVRARLLSIVLQEKQENIQSENGFFDDKIPTKIHLELDSEKFKRNTKGEYTFAAANSYSNRITPRILAIFFEGLNVTIPEHPYAKFTIDYIIRKMVSIIAKYPHYRRFRGFYTKGKPQILDDYLKKLKDDPSHVTLKLKQAINFLANMYIPFNKNVVFTVNELLQHVLQTPTKKRSLLDLEKLPPSFFKSEIEFSSPNDTLEKFSSGEKQKIYSSASLVYHLRNVDSLHGALEDTDKLAPIMVKYRMVNIVFDEIELYFHPDLQRTFVHDIKKAIRKTRLKYIRALNIIFITHSPFILSDIPSKNVMYLKVENGLSSQLQNQQDTFGGNIHDLLARSFFLSKEGYMGEFAKRIITSAIEYLQPEMAHSHDYWNKEKVSQLIKLIGEPIIKQGMRELFNIKFKSVEDIDNQIEELQKQKQNILEKINDSDFNKYR